ncbi:MAG: circularly permuted type 2 ATP-grasp protein [Deltaproteobacteria bacterium]|nr:circularly permuted type 2 ATP-grasp protein [Deltaproteobacteria bacterium]
MANPPAKPTQQKVNEKMFAAYKPLAATYDEYFSGNSAPHPWTETILNHLESLGRDEFRARTQLASASFLQGGITFSVYSDSRGAEKIFPFDPIPRVINTREWKRIERGLKQRVEALNLFLNDIYGRQKILKDKAIPARIVLGSPVYRKEVQGIRPAKGNYIYVAGIDLVRDQQGTYRVLEDNVRVPSGVSYVLENRMVMKKVFPRLFNKVKVAPVEEYPTQLRKTITSTAKGTSMAVLTPGVYNSAYFEHSFLARRMGCDLVEGRDLTVVKNRVYAKTTQGLQRVDAIYRRIDDDFIDPAVFRKDSMIGVPGLMEAYAKGNVTLANAVGNGVADDKAIYPFVPEIIRYYLAEEPILEQVPTYICDRKEDLAFVTENIGKLVVKAVNEAGGYGMLVGPRATKREQSEFVKKVLAHPRNYIGQPLVELSACPTWFSRGPAPRRVDLRPFVLRGKDTWVLSGGLTRVALVQGSYVVNSSQGGGSKDTWVLTEEKP